MALLRSASPGSPRHALEASESAAAVLSELARSNHAYKVTPPDWSATRGPPDGLLMTW